MFKPRESEVEATGTTSVGCFKRSTYFYQPNSWFCLAFHKELFFKEMTYFHVIDVPILIPKILYTQAPRHWGTHSISVPVGLAWSLHHLPPSSPFPTIFPVGSTGLKGNQTILGKRSEAACRKPGFLQLGQTLRTLPAYCQQ